MEHLLIINAFAFELKIKYVLKRLVFIHFPPIINFHLQHLTCILRVHDILPTLVGFPICFAFGNIRKIMIK